MRLDGIEYGWDYTEFGYEFRVASNKTAVFTDVYFSDLTLPYRIDAGKNRVYRNLSGRFEKPQVICMIAGKEPEPIYGVPYPEFIVPKNAWFLAGEVARELER